MIQKIPGISYIPLLLKITNQPTNQLSVVFSVDRPSRLGWEEDPKEQHLRTQPPKLLSFVDVCFHL